MTVVEIKNYILAFGSILGSGIAYLLGGWDKAVISLLIMMALDYISGMVLAGVFKASGKTISGGMDSKVGYIGLMKKVGIILALLVATTVDRMIGSEALVRTAVIIFFVSNEGLSVLENLALMGLPLPEPLKNALNQLKQSNKINS